MKSEIKYSLYKDSSELEATRLRSILLFNGKIEKQKRQDLMSKTILSLILAGNDAKSSIVRQLLEQFNVKYNEADLDVHIKKLYGAGLLPSVEQPFVVEDENGTGFFQSLERETESLHDSILKKAESIYGPIQSKDPVKNVIRKALSVYFGMYGYSFFKVQKKEEVSVKNAAVNIVRDQLKDKRLSESVIRALADVIETPDPTQENTLMKWARAFVALETMSFDPLLNNLKRKNLSNKVFIIDTDVALYCLTDKARYSEDYGKMIARLKDMGCRLYIAPEVVDEIRNHIDAAKKLANSYRQSLFEFTDDLLYQKIGNVFIDDYVHLNRNAEDRTPFKYYIEEFYDPDFPNSQVLLTDKLKKVFSKNVLEWNFEVETDSNDFMRLENEVYQLTIQTPKAQKRTEEENWDVSYLDAMLYMAAIKNNDTGDSLEMLSGKMYIITDATRAQRAAYNLKWERKDVVCHPNALMAIMMDIGDVESRETIINLFDNPFLVYVADSIWETVDPLLKEGALIRHKGFEKLRYDVDKSFDKMLTAETSDVERRNALTDYGVYLPDMVDMGKQREASLEEENDSLIEENAKLKKALTNARSANPKALKGKLGKSAMKNKRK